MPSRRSHVIDSLVAGNSSTGGNGGGIFAVQAVFIVDGQVDFNTAVNGNGGGIAVQRGNIHVTSRNFDPTAIPPTTGSQITDNQAINGGGIWDVVGSVNVDSETLIDHNVASNDGGGIWIGLFGSLSVRTSTVSNNQAIHGGGIAAEGADAVKLFRVRIIFNKATAPGTDLAAGAGVLASDVSDLSIRESTIASNTAPSGNGGGIARRRPSGSGGRQRGNRRQHVRGVHRSRYRGYDPEFSGRVRRRHLRPERCARYHPRDVQ